MKECILKVPFEAKVDNLNVVVRANGSGKDAAAALSSVAFWWALHLQGF